MPSKSQEEMTEEDKKFLSDCHFGYAVLDENGGVWHVITYEGNYIPNRDDLFWFVRELVEDQEFNHLTARASEFKIKKVRFAYLDNGKMFIQTLEE